MPRLGRRLGPVVLFAVLLAGCSSSDDEAAGTGGGSGSGAAGGAAGVSGAGGSGNAAGTAGAGGGAAGSSSGGSAGSAGAGGWSGGSPGTVIVDDPTAARTWPAGHGEALISLWHDDALAALTITIDDNTAPDHDWWLSQAQTYGLKLTWFVITERVPSSYGGTWPGYASMIAAGHDVQSHTVSHPHGAYTLDDEYKLSQQAIESNLPGVKAITLAYPGVSQPIANDPKVAAKYYVGARGTTGHDNKIGSTDYMVVNSISGQIILETDHWAGLPNTVIKNPKQAKSYRAWHCIHYHLLKDKSSTVTGLKWIAAHSNDLWVGLFREAVLYGQERETATLTVPHVSADKVVVEVTDSLDDQQFDFPLTVKVGLDPGWSAIAATQNGKAVAAKVVQHAGKPYALVSAVPDRGPVIVTRK